MKKYCCERFESFNNAEKQMGLNIRIIKLSDAFVERGGGNNKKNKVFYITEGYSGSIQECAKKMVINYCPFCSSSLEKKYSDDTYVNEVLDLPKR